LFWEKDLQTQRLRYRIQLGYVGKGFYGGCSEKALREEIFKNGPVVVAFNASPDLYYYSSGIFITNPKNNLCTFFFVNGRIKQR